MMTGKLRWILTAMALVTIGTPLLAQQVKEAKSSIFSSEEEAIEVAKLSFIDADDLASAIRQLKLPIHVAAIDDQQILLRGQKEVVDLVLKSVIKVLDVPETDQETLKTAILPLPTGLRNAREVMPLVYTVAPIGGRSRIAVDDRTRTLVVRGPKKEIDAVKGVLAHLSQSTHTVLVECFFIRGKLRGETSSDVELPKRLSSVGKALSESGLTNLKLLAPMVIQSQEGARFTSEALFGEAYLNNTGSAGEMTFSVTGTVQLGGDERVAELTLDSQVRGNYHNQKNSDGTTRFNLKTTVGVPVGDYAILAAAPSSTASGDVIALAVRVTTK